MEKLGVGDVGKNSQDKEKVDSKYDHSQQMLGVASKTSSVKE